MPSANQPPRFKCVIFDMDGTLTQTNELIFATFNHVAQKYIGKTFTPGEIVGMFGPPEEVAVENIVGRDRSDLAMNDFLRFYGDNLPRMAVTYDGMKDLIVFLYKKGVRLGIFTGKGMRTTKQTLDHFGIGQYFDMVVSGTDVKNHKPSGDGIKLILNRFKLDPREVLMVGDAVSDIRAAREAKTPIASVVWDSYAKEAILTMEVDYLFHSVVDFDRWLRAAIEGTPVPSPGPGT